MNTNEEDCRPQLQKLQKQMQKVTQQACEQSYFYAQAGHDLRQPLQALKIFVSLLKDEQLTPAQKELVSKIDNSTSDLSFWLDNLFENAKLGSRNIQRHDTCFELSVFLSKIAEEYREIAAYKNISFEYSGATVHLKTDEILLARIVRNLLNNALKYSRGKIRLYWYILPHKVKIIIKDNGYGIKREESTQIFTAFYQCLQHQSQGSGLGLAIVKELAERLDAEVFVKSKWRKGTLSILTLPLPME